MSSPVIKLIVAHPPSRAIGKEGAMPWHCPKDLMHFKKQTEGHAVIMGRKTFESLPGLLPNRTMIVVTRDKSFRAPGVIVVNDLYHAFTSVPYGKIAWVIGGGEIYRQAMEYAHEAVVSEFYNEDLGRGADTFFPELAESMGWTKVGFKMGDEDGDLAFAIWTYANTNTRPLSALKSSLGIEGATAPSGAVTGV